MSGTDAQAGFYYQNVLGALRALDLIELGNPLSSVSFDNPSLADYIDDIVAEGEDFTEFVQVKWAQDGDTSFTFANLTSADDSSSVPLLSKLAAGFRKIQNLGGTKSVILHSTKRAGITAQPAKGFNKSLASFIADFHTPFRKDALNLELEKAQNYSDYKQILDSLFGLTGFTDRSSFSAFLKSLRFDLSQPDRDSLVLRLKMRLARLGIDDRQASFLTNKVVEWSIDEAVVRAEDMLRELGLKDRFVDSLKQNFPIDIERIVPVPTVVDAVGKALDSLPSGYILIEGEPGVGKSTALSMLRAYRRDVTIEYFCFIPNEHSIGNRRMDSASFIRSLCIGLKNAFPDIELPQTFAEFSKATLDNWLNFLSSQQFRVILVVDGLDHVDSKHRQGLLPNPLTNALDGTLPPGIFMILGSQYIEALPSEVQDQIRSDERRLIKVRRFDPAQIEEFFRRRHIQLSADNLGVAQEISGGVPIYLEYLANTLAGLSEYEQERFLQSVPSIRDSKIDAYHSHLWHAIERDDTAVSILALLAIRQDFTTTDDLVDLLTIMKISPTRLSVESSLKTIAHVLRVSDAQGYAIRHESFRMFVAEKTVSLTQSLNAVLNQWYADHPTTNEAWRHRFRHLYELGHYKELLNACDDAWLRKSWSQFRPFAEINENIDFAWRAASDLRDLTQFVRIALMRQRVSLVKENLAKDEAEIGLVLLELGRPQEALLRVWDGDRAISGQVEFAKFCLYHRKLIGRPPSIDVMQQGLGDSLPTGMSPDSHETYYRACTYTSDPASLITHVAGLSWRQKGEARTQVKRLNTEQSSVINRRIERGIVDELHEREAISVLLEIGETDTIAADIRQYARLAAAATLAKSGEHEEATRLLNEGKPDLLQLETIAPYLIALAEAGIDVSSLNKTSGKPEVPLTLIETPSQKLNPEIFEIYDRFRLFCLVDPNAIPWLEARVSGMPPALSALLLAFGKLAKLWSDRVSGKQKPNLQTSAPFVEIARGFLQVRRHLRGPDSHLYLYDPELPEFIKWLWDEATKTLETDQLIELARSWEKLQSESEHRAPAEATRDLALCLSSRLAPGHEVVDDLLRMAEKDSRAEEETTVITSELLATASAWGRSGFLDNAQRLWEELVDVACGIYYRKDYQFNEVLLPMELAHKQDPEGTLGRISEQLVLAHQLEDAARSKTIAIAIEELTAFSVRVSPSLSLEMLEREQGSVFRERAIKNLLRELLTDPSIDPLLLWSLASTMNIWEDYQAFNDETLPALKSVFESCIKRQLQNATEIIYRQARHLLLVQKNMPNVLGSWANIWIEAGNAPASVHADRDQYSVTSPEPKSEETLESLFEPVDVAKLDDAAKRGIPELELELDAMEDLALKQERHRELEKLKDEWERSVQSALGRKLTDDENSAFQESFQKFGDLVANISGTDGATIKQTVLQALSDFASDLEARVVITTSLQDSLAGFDVDAWLKQFLHIGPARYTTERVLEKRIPQWIADAKLRDLRALTDFCRRRCWAEVKGKALCAIARRYKALDRPKALDLLVEAWESSSEFFFLHKQLARSILSEAIALDRDRGLKLLFDSFREHHQRYPQNIVHQLDEVVRFADQFPATDFVEFYGIWSEYNRNLTSGLSVKPVEVAWLRDSSPATFSESCSGYLVRMLNYADVDVRLLAADACYSLLMSNKVTVSTLLSMWPGLNAIQKEHLTSLLFSYGWARPETVQEWSPDLLRLANEETHFNIRWTASQLVTAIEDAGTILPQLIHDQAIKLRERQSLTAPKQATVHVPGRRSIPCLPYTCYLISELRKIAPDDSVDSQLFSFVLRHLGEPQEGYAEEGETHRAHNINTNFDTVEISGRYDQTIRTGINVILEELFRSGQVQHKDAARFGSLLRAEDPTDRLVTAEEKPSRIDWIDPNLSSDDFKNFADWDAILDRLRNPTDNWISLFEETEQRISDRLGGGRPARSTKIYASLFYTPSGQKSVDMRELSDHRPAWMDLYRFELRSARSGPDRLNTLKRNGAFAQVSMKRFRGRERGSIAALRPDLAKELSLRQDVKDYFGYQIEDKPAVRSTEWQEAFDQGRRRHEPISTGFLLEIDKELLRDWAVRNGLSLWLEVRIKRTVDQYRPESQMKWTKRIGQIEIAL